MNSLLSFIKKEAVLCAAGLLAVVSAFIVPPSIAYLKYIDYRVQKRLPVCFAWM